MQVSFEKAASWPEILQMVSIGPDRLSSWLASVKLDQYEKM